MILKKLEFQLIIFNPVHRKHADLNSSVKHVNTTREANHWWSIILRNNTMDRRINVLNVNLRSVHKNYHVAIYTGNMCAFWFLLKLLFLAAHLAESHVAQLYMLGGSITHSLAHTLTCSHTPADNWKNQSVFLLGHWNLVCRFSEHYLRDCNNRFYLNCPPGVNRVN